MRGRSTKQSSGRNVWLFGKKGTMGVNSLPKTVTRQRRGCDLNPGPSCAWVHHSNLHSATEPVYTATAIRTRAAADFSCKFLGNLYRGIFNRAWRVALVHGICINRRPGLRVGITCRFTLSCDPIHPASSPCVCVADNRTYCLPRTIRRGRSVRVCVCVCVCVCELFYRLRPVGFMRQFCGEVSLRQIHRVHGSWK